MVPAASSPRTRSATTRRSRSARTARSTSRRSGAPSTRSSAGTRRGAPRSTSSAASPSRSLTRRRASTAGHRPQPAERRAGRAPGGPGRRRGLQGPLRPASGPAASTAARPVPRRAPPAVPGDAPPDLRRGQRVPGGAARTGGALQRLHAPGPIAAPRARAPTRLRPLGTGVDGSAPGGPADGALAQTPRSRSGLTLPLDHPRPPSPQFRGGAGPASRSARSRGALREVGQAVGATLFQVLAAVWALLLGRCCGAGRRRLLDRRRPPPAARVRIGRRLVR